MKTFTLAIAIYFLKFQHSSAFAPPLIPSRSSLTILNVASSLPEGLLKSISKSGSGPLLRRGDVATVKYTCNVVGTTLAFSKSKSQRVTVADANMIAGWETILPTMCVGERAIVTIPPELAYGPTGVAPIIPPNASIQIDLEILDSSPPVSLDLDALGFAEPNTPRTPADIANAYDIRRANMVPEREGFEGWLDKARNYYFFGFFEGETGEQAPWFLRPSITFPIAFAIVGVTFYVSFAFGGIKERGAQVTDELDEIILSSIVGNNHGLMMAMVMGILMGSSPDLML